MPDRLSNKFFLTVYNLLVQLNYRLIWKCHPRHVLELYNKSLSANHLDVGVATGIILDYFRFPTPNPRIALMDLNPNCLEVTSKRLARYHPQTYLSNVLQPIVIDAKPFDSVGLANPLHWLPGTMKTKEVAFEHLKHLLNPGATIFGCTILYDGVKRSPVATVAMNILNASRAMTNKEDDLEGLKHNLEKHFPESSVEAIGCVALFWARK